MALEQGLGRFLQRRLAAADDGKTFLLGWCADRPAFALAAGLRGAVDHPRFLTFARYLIHRRFGCDGYALLLPVVGDAGPYYVAELHHGGAARVFRATADGGLEPSALRAGLIGDLTRAGAPLPGRLRRDLDRLYAILRQPLPD